MILDLVRGVERPLRPSLKLDVFNLRLHLIILVLISVMIIEQVRIPTRSPSIDSLGYALLLQTIGFFPRPAPPAENR